MATSLTFVCKEIRKYVIVEGYMICTKLLWRQCLVSWTNIDKNELSKHGQCSFDWIQYNLFDMSTYFLRQICPYFTM